MKEPTTVDPWVGNHNQACWIAAQMLADHEIENINFTCEVVEYGEGFVVQIKVGDLEPVLLPAE